MVEATYARIGYIDEKATVFVLRVAFAFLSAASLFALVATLTYIKAANTAATNTDHARSRASPGFSTDSAIRCEKSRQWQC